MGLDDARGELARADAALRAGDPRHCLRICRALLARDPALAPARFMAGVASLQVGDAAGALEDLDRVAASGAGGPEVGLYRGMALRRCERFAEAVRVLEGLAGHPRLGLEAAYDLAAARNRLGDVHGAVAAYEGLLTARPDHVDAAANLAALLEKLNRLDEAARHADAALGHAPTHALAGLVRATLDRRAGRSEVARARLEALLERGALSRRNHALALAELARCHESLGEFDAAWARYGEANAGLAAGEPGAVPDDRASYGLATIASLREGLRRHPPDRWRAAPDDRALNPAFLLGFPRSGTTLLDRALSAHPDIEVLEEAELLEAVRRRWLDDGGIARLAAMTPEEVGEARALYGEARDALRGGRARVLVDKLPLNSVHLALIHRLFPDAPVVIALRDPRDACLSCYFQTFDLVGAMPYFLRPDTTARYYDAVLGLLDEAREALPLRAHEVRYERVVTDFEAELRRLVAFLGLSWDPQVLDYRARSIGRRINTPSYQQVVQPLHTRSVGRWRHYETHLAEPFRPLARWVRRLGYADAD